MLRQSEDQWRRLVQTRILGGTIQDRFFHGRVRWSSFLSKDMIYFLDPGILPLRERIDCDVKNDYLL